MQVKKVIIASDHAGCPLKEAIINHLKEQDITVFNYGTNDENTSVDYPDYAVKVVRGIVHGEAQYGILICGTGIGISIAANKVKGIRAALCHDCFSAKATREHNNANVLAMGGRIIGAGHALDVVDLFLDTPFSNDPRHIRRIQGIEG